MIAKKINIIRFSSFMLALGILLSITVTGCATKDREGGHIAQMVELAYKFTQVHDIQAKANLSAETVELSAYDDTDVAVAVEQATERISEHQDVTPADVTSAYVWEGTAIVAPSATKLVLTYFDANGNEVGSPDIVTNVILKEGAVVDFTNGDEPSVEVTWTPVKVAQTIAVDEVAIITAKDDQNNALTVELLNAAEGKLSVDGAKVTGIEATAEDETADVTAIAKNANGDFIAARTYNFTVLATVHKVTWDPAEDNPTLKVGNTTTVTAHDEDDHELTIELSSATDEVSINGAEITGEKATAEGVPVEVTATAKDATGRIYDVKPFSFTVVNPTIIWEPVDATNSLKVDRKCIITAHDEDDKAYTVELSAATDEVSINGAEITGVKHTAEGNPVAVTATAKDAQGRVYDTNNYSFTVVYHNISWNPVHDNPKLKVAEKCTIAAIDEDSTALTVELTAASDEVSVSCAEVTGVKPTAAGAPVAVTAIAKDANNYVVGEYTFNFSVDYQNVWWSPNISPQSLKTGKSITFTATSEDKKALKVELTATTDEVRIDGAKVTGAKPTATGVPVEVTAIAKDENNFVVDDITIKFNIRYQTVTFKAGDYKVSPKTPQVVTAKDDSGADVSVEITTNSPDVTIENKNTVRGVNPTKAARVTANAVDANGIILETRVLKFEVFSAIPTFTPAPGSLNMKVGQTIEITAVDDSGRKCTVSWESNGPGLSGDSNKLTAVEETQPGETPNAVFSVKLSSTETVLAGYYVTVTK